MAYSCEFIFRNGFQYYLLLINVIFGSFQISTISWTLDPLLIAGILQQIQDNYKSARTHFWKYYFGNGGNPQTWQDGNVCTKVSEIWNLKFDNVTFWWCFPFYICGTVWEIFGKGGHRNIMKIRVINFWKSWRWDQYLPENERIIL